MAPTRRLLLLTVIPFCLALMSQTPAPASTTASGECPDAEEPAPQQILRSFSLDLGGLSDRVNSPYIPLTVQLHLRSAPKEWLQVSLPVPDGYRLSDHESGESASVYFYGPNVSPKLTLQLRRLSPEPSAVSFPLTVTSKEGTGQLIIYLRAGPDGAAAAGLLADERSRPIWPSSPGNSYWVFHTTASDALQFVAEVSNITIELPGRLVAMIRSGGQRTSFEPILMNICADCGCVYQQLSERRYRVRFADTYRGAPDASWFVVKHNSRFHFRVAQAMPITDLIEALIDLGGASIADSPDLAWATIRTDWQSDTIPEALDWICRCSNPPMVWSAQDGAYHFELKPPE